MEWLISLNFGWQMLIVGGGALLGALILAAVLIGLDNLFDKSGNAGGPGYDSTADDLSVQSNLLTAQLNNLNTQITTDFNVHHNF